MQRNLMLIGFLAITALAATTGAKFTPGAWYLTLAKPSWTPPGWLFGPVWTVLYVMIAVAGWMVWREAGWSTPLVFWGVQLILNTAWSVIMFGAHRIGWALADLVLLWLAIAGFILTAWPISSTAALLFLPYLAWVSFAGALNFAIWRLNP
jgi:benzodiazapine receptor